MEEKLKKLIPPSVIHRLPEYLLHLQKLDPNRGQWISSGEIAAALGLTSSTVRQDLSYLNSSGISKKGYRIAELEGSLLEILGVGKPINMILIGVGNLGKAIAQHNGFSGYGFHLHHIFDNDPVVIGQQIGGHVVRDVALLQPLCREKRIDIGLLTVPHHMAQQVADSMMDAGIRGILNFTSAHIITRENTRVVDNRIILKLIELNCIIRQSH